MKSTHSWRKGCYRLIMPNSLLLATSLGFALSLGTAQASGGAGNYDVTNADSNLSNSDAWTPAGGPPNQADAATWDDTIPEVKANDGGNTANEISSFTTGAGQSATSININSWAKTVMVDTNGSTVTDANVITLTGNPVINTAGNGLDLGNLQVNPTIVNPSSGLTTAFDLQNQLTITGALSTTPTQNTTILIEGTAPLNLVGQSNAGSISPGTSSGEINLTETNGSTLTLGNNNGSSPQTKTFGLLTVNGNSTLTEDYASSNTTPSAGNGFNNSAFAVSGKTQYTFTQGLSFQNSAILTINGWQGTPGHSSIDGQLLFNNDGNTLVLDSEVKDVLFDLAGDATTMTSPVQVPGESTAYDYGEWIADPTNSTLDELVPYAAVPEPKTIIGGLALLSVLAWRERKRLAGLGAQFLGRPENCL